MPCFRRFKLDRVNPIVWKRIFVGLMGVTLSAGSCLTVDRPYSPPSAEALIRSIQQRAESVTTLRAEAKMTHRDRGDAIKATVRFMTSRTPHTTQVRFDVVSPFDTPLATLVSDTNTFSLVDAQKNRHYYGPALPCNLARLIGIELPVEAIVAILNGSMALIAYDSAEVAWDGREGVEVLTLHGKTLQQTIRLESRDRRWNVLSSEIVDTQGERLLYIVAQGYRREGELWHPQQITVQQTVRHTKTPYERFLSLSFKKRDVNVTLEPVAFEPLKQEGLISEEVRCRPEN